MRWVSAARERARTRLANARQRSAAAVPDRPHAGRHHRPGGRRGTGIRRRRPHSPGVRIAAAWAWRLILFAATTCLIIRVIALLHLVVIPVAVALLLAALFEPAVRGLRRRRVNRSLAAGMVLVGGLVSAGLAPRTACASRC